MAAALARLARRRATLYAPLMATAALSFVPRRPATCRASERFFGSQQGDEDDVARLRRENADLKRRLRSQEEPADDGGFLGGLAKTFGFGKSEAKKERERQEKAISREIDEVFKGGGLVGSMMGAMAKGVVGMVGSAFAETKNDMDAVLATMEGALASRLGDDVRCDAPMQQMYSSSNINGRVTKQVQLVTSARGSKGVGTVRCVATITDLVNGKLSR